MNRLTWFGIGLFQSAMVVAAIAFLDPFWAAFGGVNLGMCIMGFVEDI